MAATAIEIEISLYFVNRLTKLNMQKIDSKIDSI